MERLELLQTCAAYIEKIPDTLNYVTPVELKEMLTRSSESVFILDVRNTEAYNESHIEGAVNIVLDELFLESSLAILPYNKPVVVCCGIGHVASQVLTLLQLLGYNSIGLKYGMGISTVSGEVQKGWVELGYPVQTV